MACKPALDNAAARLARSVPCSRSWSARAAARRSHSAPDGPDAARLADDLASASGVKEQGAGIYAQNLAERGFVAMAFDESFNGESGGEPRHVSSPDIFVEDFSAGVD